MAKFAVGIDIGGTGIKGALVNLKTGQLASDRLKYATPEGGGPQDIAGVVKELVGRLPVDTGNLPIGICFPAVVESGVTKSAANISDDWINLQAKKLFTKALGQKVSVMNDADAAGYAESVFGAARGVPGLVIMTTLGTGIGGALIFDGVLIPNAELGHLELDGVDYETMAAFSAKEREGLSWEAWAKRLQRYYSHLEAIFHPELFIVGGGVSKEHESFLPLLKLETEILPAENRNNAGILGAAALAAKKSK